MRGSLVPVAVEIRMRRCYYNLLTVLDCFFSACILTPIVVVYWRSTWILMDHYVFPETPLASALVSVAIGVFGHILFLVVQYFLNKHFHPDQHRITFYIVSRFYTEVFAFVCVNGWRGPWILIDIYNTPLVENVCAIAGVGIVALLCMRGVRNIMAAPFGVSLDLSKGYFDVPTMFRVSASENLSLYILDCLCSVLIVGTLVVFVWRGAWVLMDILIFPDDEVLSTFTSLIVGYVIVALAFLFQPFAKWVCDKTTGVARLFAADIYIIFAFIGTINVWRGAWNFLNIYLFPESKILSCWISHWISLIFLILLGCSNSLLVRGVYIDAEEPAGQCVVFPCHYLRIILQNEREKKNSLNLTNLQNNVQDDKKVTENNCNLTEKYVSNHKETV